MAISLNPQQLWQKVNSAEATKREHPLSTVAFDSLYVMLSLLLTVGIMLDVWSHMEFGPDQSIFNEYHLLFYGAMAAIMGLLTGLFANNIRSGHAITNALPKGYGLGLVAVIIFGASGVIDLSGHAIFGFESDIEALTSPTHLPLFINWLLILAAPLLAARTRITVTGKTANLRQSLPSLLAFGCMLACISIPLMIYFPMGFNPYMTQSYRQMDDFSGWVMGISGMFLQTIITVGFVLWLTREFKMPRGGYVVALGFYGLFVSMLNGEQWPWAMFGGLGIILEIAYAILKPDATRRLQFLAFALTMSTGMWFMTYSTLAYLEGGMHIFYYSGYNFYGSIAQAVCLSALVAYAMSMPAPKAVAIAD